MTLTFYRNKSDTNVMRKEIAPALNTSLFGVLREGSSVLAPTITVEISDVSLLNSVNYAYISDFDRYYYVTDIASLRNTLATITMRVDVLMSYSDSIRKSSALIKRNAYQYNLKLNDGSLAAYADGYVLAYKFSGGFNTNQFVLIVAGGS